MQASSDGGGGGSIFTPPPGNPRAIRAAATRLRSAAGRAGDAAGHVSRGCAAVVDEGAWTGTAASAFTDRGAGVARLSAGIEQPTLAIAAACATHADHLETAQRRIADARDRYQAAQAGIDGLNQSVGVPMTDAELAVRAGQATALQTAQRAAVADAQAAWSAYDISRAGSTSAVGLVPMDVGADVDGILAWIDRAVVQGKPWTPLYNELNVIGSIYGAGTAVPNLVNLLSNLAKGERYVPTIDAIAETLQSVASGTSKAAEEAGLLASKAQGALEALRIAAADGSLSAAEAAQLAWLERNAPGLMADAERVGQNAAKVATQAKGFVGATRVFGALAILGDADTVLHPLDSGVMGRVDQGMAVANAAGVGVGLAASAGVIASTGWIPVVGEVVAVGTGLYLAGDWLYHNNEGFRNFCNGTADAAVKLGKAQTALAVDAAQTGWNTAKDVGAGAVQGAKDLAAGAGSTVDHLAHGDVGGAAQAVGQTANAVASDVASTASNVAHDVSDGAHKAWDTITHIF